MMPHILLIHDSSGPSLDWLHRTISDTFDDVEVVGSSATADRVGRGSPDVVLLALGTPDGCLDVFADIRAIDANVPVIFIAEEKDADAAIQAMKLGAFDYLYRSVDSQVLRVVGDAVEVAKRTRSPLRLVDSARDGDVDDAMFGGDAMLEIYKAIGRVAAKDLTVLITGESGTGKEMVARSIRKHSARADGPFVALNCAAIPAGLLESELFGHEKGAFTGADRRRIGKFEQCDGGTLLLDEIGDMPLALQAKILRVLHEQAFERVGGNTTIHSNVRLIACTHRDLKALAAQEKFRSDLYYRLAVFKIHLPPLRERGEDLTLLAYHFLRRFGRELGCTVHEIAPEALEKLHAYSWPGNIRELQNVIKQALLRASGPVLVPAFLPPLVEPIAGASAPCGELDSFIRDQLVSGKGDLYEQVHSFVDRRLFATALLHSHGNQSSAAKQLGISRQTMRTRMRALRLHLERDFRVMAGGSNGPALLELGEP